MIAKNGIEYENKVLQSILVARELLANVQVHAQNTAAFDSTKTDISLEVHGNTVNVEVKADSTAQMGGTSVQFFIDENGTSVTLANKKNNIDQNIQDVIISAVKEKQEHIFDLIKYWKNQAPYDYHANIKGIPGNVTKTAWVGSVNEGLLQPINTKIELGCEFMHKHYAKKNCYYIQIGKSGLFYMQENPLDLPVPQLTGDLIGEIRVTRNGSKLNKTVGEKTATTGIRVQGRLNFKCKSDYSLDNPKDVVHLFNK